MRVESDRPMANGGWFHAWGNGSTMPIPAHYKPVAASERPKPTIPLSVILANAKRETTTERVIQHAEQLGVSPASLFLLGAAWYPEKNCWLWPMRDADSRLIGLRCRTEGGDQFAITGSRAGLFIPTGKPSSPLFILEGQSDLAALLTLGLSGIARQSCLGCETLVNDFIRIHKIRQVVIVSDADEPGQRGAAKLQSTLKVPSKIWTPPAADFREAVRNGMDAEDVQNMVKDLRWEIVK